jgi:hypothetical protein
MYFLHLCGLHHISKHLILLNYRNNLYICTVSSIFVCVHIITSRLVFRRSLRHTSWRSVGATPSIVATITILPRHGGDRRSDWL